MLLDQRRRDNSYLVHTQTSDGPSTSGSVPPRREKGLNIWWNIGQGPNICIELFALASFFGLKYSVESFRVRKGLVSEWREAEGWEDELHGVPGGSLRITRAGLHAQLQHVTSGRWVPRARP